jgi:hypothetical protein
MTQSPFYTAGANRRKPYYRKRHTTGFDATAGLQTDCAPACRPTARRLADLLRAGWQTNCPLACRPPARRSVTVHNTLQIF